MFTLRHCKKIPMTSCCETATFLTALSPMHTCTHLDLSAAGKIADRCRTHCDHQYLYISLPISPFIQMVAHQWQTQECQVIDWCRRPACSRGVGSSRGDEEEACNPGQRPMGCYQAAQHLPASSLRLPLAGGHFAEKA